jgi:hypothetical protein
MNNEFLKMQKLAGLITESQVKEIIGDIDDTPSPDGDFDPMDYADNPGYKRLDQEDYMEALNLFFDALGNGANAYDESTYKKDSLEYALVKSISSILNQAGVDIS